MKSKNKSLLQQRQTPLVYHFNTLAKGYFGVLTTELHDLELERYYLVLTLITQHKMISQQSLADALDIDKANMVRIIDQLTHEGYVSRKANSQDKREHVIVPTKKAEKIVPALTKAFKKVNRLTVKGFTTDETNLFYDLLERACNNLSASTSDKYFLKYIKTKTKQK